MSDKELEEYINKIEPNFDSHLEKGTIEMSNEYYNLLEEKMARLINENQELKKQHEELDKKLFFTKNELDMRQKSIDNKLNQQKEFIEYMNKTIEELPIIKNADNTTSLQGKDYNYTMKTVDVILANKINELVREIRKLKDKYEI